nr:30S ribosomal protein S12 methylthiotransferase RimO [candidate division Zixibacteria bacterium]
MKFYIKKLGCPKNDVDGDYLAGRLVQLGHELVADSEGAEAIIVNTCGFILPAKEESIAEILQFEEQKKRGRIKKLFVTGCLSQRYGEDLQRDIPGVDGFFGLGKIEALIERLDSNLTGGYLVRDPASELTYTSGDIRYVEESYPYAYLKIAEGCDRYCAYCAIPYIRGRYRSRPIREIIDEAQLLASRGKKELILVSQEGSGYGRDSKDGTDIIDLLKALEKVAGVEWIRLMYLHPEAVTKQLIDYLTGSAKVLGYFDIPLQHVSDKILKKMNRRVTRREIENLLEKIRQASAENIIRTTFITGFPGETERDFEELHEFMESFKFNRLGVFAYSPEEGTAAVKMGRRPSARMAAERQDILMSLQQGIAFEKNISLIDKIQKVIIDEIRQGAPAVGRSMGDCPEIDQQVYVKGEGLVVGDIVKARIVMAEGYDLIAEKAGG